MTSAPRLIDRLLRDGVELSGVDGRLVVRGPKAKVTRELLATIREHKAKLLPLVTQTWARRAAGLLSSIADPDRRADLRLQFEERSAIAEYDGGLSRNEADKLAFHELQEAIHAHVHGAALAPPQDHNGRRVPATTHTPAKAGKDRT
jgi:hypothetical protein